MAKGICFYFGYPIEPKERAKLIREAGFDHIIASTDDRFNHQNGTLEEQVEYFKKNGLTLSSLHSKYTASELPEFFKEGEIGDRMEQSLISDVLLAKKYGFTCVVVHLFGEPSQIGLDRLKRVLKMCEQTNIPLAIENIDCQKVFLYVFENISHPLLRFCYDCGHHNIFDRDYDYLKNFGDKLICLHLHDNMGESDDHTVKKYGTIDWDKLAKKLAAINPNITLDFELLFHKKYGMNASEALREAASDAKWLEERVAFYSKKK